MRNRIKITMIGGKGVGKTCFTLGMYAVMRRGVHNFFLHTPDANDDNRLMRAWSALLKEGAERQWPVPTSASIERYEFQFKRGLNRTLMDFEWIDYRGGALLDESTNAQELNEQLVDSDCLFFCVDGGLLAEPVGNRVYQLDDEMCISRAKVLLDKLPKKVPIVILITKHDLCRQRKKDALLHDIKKLFDAWLVPGENWDVMVCPVTLGGDLATDLNSGPINPRNMYLPLVYGVFELLLERLVQKERERKEKRDSFTKVKRRMKELSSNFLLEFWNKSEIEQASSEADQITFQQRRLEREAQGLRDDVASLGAELTKAVMFSNGERVKVED